jgi:hypothetical protein
VDKVKIDYDKKIAYVTMSPGTELKKETVSEAFKKTKRYGLTGFAEKKPAPKSGIVTIGLSGMT